MEHQEKLERVVTQLRRHDGGRPLSLRKRAVSHVVPQRKDKRFTDDKIDLTTLDAILEVDVGARTCTAEPGVTFDRLVEATLPTGSSPSSSPSSGPFTVGGAVTGCSLESASFKYGGFHDTCLEYEIVTARGEVLRATSASPRSRASSTPRRTRTATTGSRSITARPRAAPRTTCERRTDAHLVQLLRPGDVLEHLEQAELRPREGDLRSDEPLPRSLRQDLPRASRARRLSELGEDLLQ